MISVRASTEIVSIQEGIETTKKEPVRNEEYNRNDEYTRRDL